MVKSNSLLMSILPTALISVLENKSKLNGPKVPLSTLFAPSRQVTSKLISFNG